MSLEVGPFSVKTSDENTALPIIVIVTLQRTHLSMLRLLTHRTVNSSCVLFYVTKYVEIFLCGNGKQICYTNTKYRKSAVAMLITEKGISS